MSHKDRNQTIIRPLFSTSHTEPATSNAPPLPAPIYHSVMPRHPPHPLILLERHPLQVPISRQWIHPVTPLFWPIMAARWIRTAPIPAPILSSALLLSPISIPPPPSSAIATMNPPRPIFHTSPIITRSNTQHPIVPTPHGLGR